MFSPEFVDGFEFARSRSVRRGRLDFSVLERVRSLPYFLAGAGDVVLAGQVDAEGRPELIVGIEGHLDLTCQRCLSEIRQIIDVDACLRLVGSEAELDAGEERDDVERIVAGRRMKPLDIVEDEILLAIPYSPRHERCEVEAKVEADDGRANGSATLHAQLQNWGAGSRGQKQVSRSGKGRFPRAGKAPAIR